MSLTKIGLNLSTKFGVRNGSYLHVGTRVRGLKRDPVESLKNPHGLHYDSLVKDGHVSTVKQGLNLEKYGIDLPDDIITQCLTHKSFAQGIKPYNQKLSIIGGHFVKYQACLHSLGLPVSERQLSQSVQSEPVINGLNFGMLGKGSSKMLISKQSTAEFLQRRNLDKLVFWNKRDTQKSHKYNGEYTVLQTVLNSVVGSVYLLHGQDKATEYVLHELFSDNSDSLTKISESLLANRDTTEKL
ncbi:mitochondrial 54S ribosomal protein mL57 [Kluyveromyces lactis]|uniref:KLLA0C17402p n=1 Tax=Kluyveromyces lactis (strain ATCC 8585 / CBS 2359 / DSM 70799 / NBRC 1267 / NRRL Y-1140 / WM37) TaxID=284590 RepID=Q6CSW2_KLULA|nr:uncharacterized protein KLLA0_C17402g [Kluyveromyces lactis]CAH01828.1 KLLA0C17402p [Kluyveromyces lactis]|eukprot:XP_452977.1 uncharacterized protein KLLA0_C17402g [Kluyveromyces lactis]